MSLLKATYTFLLLSIIFISPIFAQNSSYVKWNLVPPDSQNVSIDSGFVNGNKVTGSSLLVRDYTGVLSDGSSGPLGKFQRWYLNANWPDESKQNNQRYIQFEVKPDSGFRLNVTSVTLYLNAGGTGNMVANLYYSAETSFSNAVLLNKSGSIAVSRSAVSLSNYQVQAVVKSGQSFYLRVYPWLPGGSSNSGKYIYIQNVTISGFTVPSGDTSSVTLPIVSTLDITNINAFSANGGGNVINNGGAVVTSRGVCWNTNGMPNVKDNKTEDGNGKGEYTSLLTGLSPQTLYYVRAFAENSAGVNYGAEVTFKTKEDTTGKLLAFPGAEGFGRYTSGGRGGRVYEVTNLNDDGQPGSFRWAVEQSGPRIIVFRVSGTIMLNSDLNITHGDLTIAGQTAPGDGICIANHTVECKASNVIVRYMRFRLGDLTAEADDSFWGRYQKNIILDHLSISWAIDEDGSWYDNKDFTMQWCVYSESLYHSYHPKGNHGYGGIWGGMGATFHHNLLADNSSRNPRFNGARYTTTHATELVDFRNNVIFNWGFNSAYGGESGNQNMINNYFKPGPATGGGSTRYRIVQPYDVHTQTAPFSKWYVAGNYMEGNSAVTADNWNGGVQPNDYKVPLDSLRLNSPLTSAPVNTQSAFSAYISVLKNVGDNFPARDSADLRVINEVETGDAPFGATYSGGNKGIIDSQTDVGGWPALAATNPPKDSDHDGMPDDWETAHGLNPNDSTDAIQVAPDGYTYVENYINSLVPQNILAFKKANKAPAEFALLQNYPNPFNPVTTIEFSTPKTSKIKLEVFDLLGRKVSVLINGVSNAGNHSITFNGAALSSGVYIYRLSTPQQIISRKMILMK